jgi:hypothetical protein
MGMFQQVSEMNEAFGNPKGIPSEFEDQVSVNGVLAPQITKWDRIRSQCKNILSEYNELLEGLDERNITKVRDALCDINVFSLGAHHLLGLNADDDMTAVVDALFSRFCVDETHLNATSIHYLNMGVQHYYEGEFPRRCLKSSHDQGWTEAKDGSGYWEYPKGKFLKALGYHQPEFK